MYRYVCTVTALITTGCLVCALLITPLAANSQSSVVLSDLPERTKRLLQKDTAEIHKRINLVTDHFAHQPDTALKILETVAELSMLGGYPDGVAIAWILKSSFYRITNRKQLYFQAIETADWYLRNAAFYNKDKVLRLWYYYKARAMSDEQQYDSSLYYLHNAEQKALKDKDPLFLYLVNMQIANLWIKTDAVSNALPYIKKMELLVDHLGSEERKNKYSPNILILYIKVYNNVFDTTALFRYAHKAIETGKKNANSKLQTMGNCVLANYYISRNKPDLAIRYAQEALQVCDTSEYDYLCGAYWALSLGYYKKKQFLKAKTYALKALENSDKKIGFAESQVSLYKHIAKVLYVSGDSGQAYLYQLRYSQLSDSLNDVERHNAINKIETRYRIAEKDKALTQQQLELNRKESRLKISRILLTSGIAVSVLLLILLLLLSRNARNRHRQIQQGVAIRELEAAIESEQKERSRIAMELHDGIISSLTAIKLNLDITRPAAEYTDIYRENLEQLEAVILDVRNTAHNLMPEILVRHHPDKAVELLCNLIEHTGKLNVQYLSYGDFSEIDPETGLTIYRIVQELLHNIIKHAQAEKALVQLSCYDRLLFLTVEDNGKGMAPDLSKKNGGTGFKNIQKRVEAMNGSIKSGESGFGSGMSVHIELELKR